MAEARSRRQSPRDKLAEGLMRFLGDDTPSKRQFVRNLVGSAGAGSTGRMSLIDWTPFGVPLPK